MIGMPISLRGELWNLKIAAPIVGELGRKLFFFKRYLFNEEWYFLGGSQQNFSDSKKSNKILCEVL